MLRVCELSDFFPGDTKSEHDLELILQLYSLCSGLSFLRRELGDIFLCDGVTWRGRCSIVIFLGWDVLVEVLAEELNFPNRRISETFSFGNMIGPYRASLSAHALIGIPVQ